MQLSSYISFLLCLFGLTYLWWLILLCVFFFLINICYSNPLKKKEQLYLIMVYNFKSSHQNYSVWEDVLKTFTNFTGNYLCWSLFLIKLQAWGSATLLKRDSTQLLSCEVCEIFKNTYFKEHLWTTAPTCSSISSINFSFK